MPRPVSDLGAKRTSSRPPRGETPPREEKTPPISTPKKRTGNDKKLQDSIEKGYQAISLGMIGWGTRTQDEGVFNSGLVMADTADSVADAWMELADKNPKVKRALQSLTEVTAIGVLVGLHIGIALPILIDRQVIPASFAAMMSEDPAATATQNGNGNASSN